MHAVVIRKTTFYYSQNSYSNHSFKRAADLLAHSGLHVCGPFLCCIYTSLNARLSSSTFEHNIGSIPEAKFLNNVLGHGTSYINRVLSFLPRRCWHINVVCGKILCKFCPWPGNVNSNNPFGTISLSNCLIENPNRPTTKYNHCLACSEVCHLTDFHRHGHGLN